MDLGMNTRRSNTQQFRYLKYDRVGGIDEVVDWFRKSEPAVGDIARQVGTSLTTLRNDVSDYLGPARYRHAVQQRAQIRREQATRRRRGHMTYEEAVSFLNASDVYDDEALSANLLALAILRKESGASSFRIDG